MPSLKTIRKRIASVKSTQQITKAMKMVSAAKLRRAQEAAVAARPYGEKLAELLGNLGAGLPSEAHPLLRSVDSPRRVHLVLVSADRGLCGAYNANVLREAEGYVEANRDAEVSMSVVGRKGVERFRRHEAGIENRWVQILGPSIELAREIAAAVVPRFASGEVDRIDVLYAKFRSAMSQIPTVERLLPVAVTRDGVETTDYLVEPDVPSLLERLLPRYVEASIYRALLEAAASEHGARMTAMDSATRNASEMIFNLTLAMNRARQAAITTELMEIVSGAEALRG